MGPAVGGFAIHRFGIDRLALIPVGLDGRSAVCLPSTFWWKGVVVNQSRPESSEASLS